MVMIRNNQLLSKYRRNFMILACHNLNKSFGDHLIVRDGSFHVEDREKAALVGVNGAGKSTFIKVITGVHQAEEGEIRPRHKKLFSKDEGEYVDFEEIKE